MSARANLANVLQDLGRYEEGEKPYHEVLQRDPNNADATVHSRLLLGLNYHIRYDPAAVFQSHVQWGEYHGIAAQATAFDNEPDPQRRLRIGYVSPDFRDYSVASFIAPVLAAHDRSRVEIFCYAAVLRSDETTRRLKSLADYWRNVCAMNDEALEALIRRDEIDILVDLAGLVPGAA